MLCCFLYTAESFHTYPPVPRNSGELSLLYGVQLLYQYGAFFLLFFLLCVPLCIVKYIYLVRQEDEWIDHLLLAIDERTVLSAAIEAAHSAHTAGAVRQISNLLLLARTITIRLFSRSICKKSSLQQSNCPFPSLSHVDHFFSKNKNEK